MTSRRRFLRQLSIAGLATSIPMAIRDVLAAGQKPVIPGIYRLSGSVLVNGQPAVLGRAIRPGDQIVTGAASEAVYVIGQDAYLQRDNSTVDIVGETLKSGLRIINGKLLSVFGKGEKSLRTSTATIGIRGTGCYIESDPAQTYVCLCYGEADFVPDVSPGKAARIKTTHHESPVWISGSNRDQPISAAPMINHTDAELELLESLVGRTVPFANSGYRY